MTDHGTGGSSNDSSHGPLGEALQAAHSPQSKPRLPHLTQGGAGSSKARSASPFAALRQAVFSPKPEECTCCPLHSGGDGSEVKSAIPLVDLHSKIPSSTRKFHLPIQHSAGAAAEPSSLHSFVATDNGVVGAATNILRGGWEYSRMSALKALDKSEATQGWLLPCITYGKTQSILVQARKGREGEAGEAKAPKSNGCNQPCIRYAAICTALPCKSGEQSDNNSCFG